MTNKPRVNMVPVDYNDTAYDSTVSEQVELSKLISEAAVRDCLLIKSRAAKKGRHLSLREIAVMRGYITNGELSQSMPVVTKRPGEVGSTLYTQGQLSHMVSSWLKQMGLTTCSSLFLMDADAGSIIPPYKPGQMLGDFRLISLVGAGPAAGIYKAVSMKAGKLCCLKVYSPDAFPTEVSRRRFKARARRTFKVRHPYIPRGYAIGEMKETGELVYVFQYIEGISLSTVLSSTKMMSEKAALAVCTQLADALGCCHERGIIHGNLKPSNVLIARSGQAYLLDAGLERTTEHAVRKVRDGQPVSEKLAEGLPYINPGSAAGDDELSQQDDVYGLGALFYRMISGRSPYSGTPAEVVAKVAGDRFPAFDTQHVTVSTPTRFVVAKMTRREREDRYKDMPIVVIELQRCLGQVEQVQEESTSVKNVFQNLDSALDSITTPEKPPPAEQPPETDKRSQSDKLAELLERYESELEPESTDDGVTGTQTDSEEDAPSSGSEL